MASNTDYRIDTDSPVASDLLFWSVIGHEALSRPSVYELTVLSANPDIQAADILGRSFDVTIGFEDSGGGTYERHCQGVAVRFARRHTLGRYHEYRIELRSWFWLLQKRRNSRILGDDKDEGQAKNALEILDIVLENSPIRAIQKVKRDGLGKHEARGYTVQYQESDYHYLSRLLEDEGIYYWFDVHTAPGTLCLADNSSVAHEPLPVADVLRHVPGGASEGRFNEVWSWESERKLDTGWFDSRDSNYRKIRTSLGALGGDLEAHELADFEEFEFPGGYPDQAEAEVVLRNRVDELRSRRERNWALTGWPDVAPGRSFSYENDPDPARNGKYLIGSCIVVAVHPGHESVPRPPTDIWALRRMMDRALADDAVNGDTADTLRRLVESAPSLRDMVLGTRAFVITTWPASVNYKPPRLTPRVRMPGPQSAIVVGPKGEEIPENGEDLYVDAYGRVKVFFHWNRYEKDKKDFDGQKWSAWLRVSQPMAGKKWGGYFAPRIGQEVIVDFLDGDPDRPLIVGRVYNDDQPIPYDSPTQSGFKTRSSPNGKASNYNEIMFEDKKGHENLNVHAERNMSRSVEVDDSTTVGHNQSVTVENNREVTIKQFDKQTVGKNFDVDIHGFNTSKVGKDYALLVKGNLLTQAEGFRTDVSVLGELRTVGVGQTIGVSGPVIHGSASLAVTTGAMTLGATGIAMTSSGATSITTKAARTDVSSGQHTLASEVKVKVVAGTDIEILANAAITQISMDSNTTVLGGNSSGYIGTASEATMGISRSTFMGLQMSNALALSIDNFAGINMSNNAALQITNTAVSAIEMTGIDLDMSTVHIELAGSGGGAATGAAVVAGVAGLISAAFGANDTIATLQQYANAATTLREAAVDLGVDSPLGKKLSALAEVAVTRQREGQIGVAVAGAVVGGVLAGPEGALYGAAAAGGAGVLLTDESKSIEQIQAERNKSNPT